MELKEKVLFAIMENARMSDTQIAKKLKCAQSTVFRIRNELEQSNIIWGYVPVVDWSKLGYSTYLLLIKVKGATKDSIERAIKDVKEDVATKQGIKTINICTAFGDFDWAILFSSSSETNAQKYIDSIKTTYGKFLDGRPEKAKMSFHCKLIGRINPEIEKLKEFVPF